MLRWDLEARALALEIETLPLVPPLRVVGRELEWDGASVLTYRVGERPPSAWDVFHVDEAAGVAAAESSVTGLNVLRRLDDDDDGEGGGGRARREGGWGKRRGAAAWSAVGLLDVLRDPAAFMEDDD